MEDRDQIDPPANTRSAKDQGALGADGMRPSRVTEQPSADKRWPDNKRWPDKATLDKTMSGNAMPDEASDGDGRPLEVPGPFGESLTFSSLPAPDTRRWVVRRKAEVLAAINGGLLTTEEACARYGLSPEELELWQKSLDLAGVPGLRVTRIQLYRDYEEEKRARQSRRDAENHVSY